MRVNKKPPEKRPSNRHFLVTNNYIDTVIPRKLGRQFFDKRLGSTIICVSV